MNKRFDEAINRLTSCIGGDKKTLIIILVGVIGIFLVFVSELPFDADQYEKEYIDAGSNTQAVKEELEEIISRIKGVGRASVMITFEGTSESIYANNIYEQNDEGRVKTENEPLVLDKGNIEDGLLLKEIYPRVTGVAVVCEGGSNPTVKNEVTLMLKALYGIGSNNICISEMKD